MTCADEEFFVEDQEQQYLSADITRPRAGELVGTLGEERAPHEPVL
jgi:hypothetical protein